MQDCDCVLSVRTALEISDANTEGKKALLIKAVMQNARHRFICAISPLVRRKNMLPHVLARQQ